MCSRRMDDLGGPLTYNHYPVAGPTRWIRRSSGRNKSPPTSAAPATAWSSPGPARIKDKGGIRSQFHHVIDIVPTLMEAAGLKLPTMLNGVKQKPLEGVSMMYTFDNAAGPDPAPDAIF